MKASNSASDISAKTVPWFRNFKKHLEVGVEGEACRSGFLRKPIGGFRCELFEAWVRRLNIL